MYEPNFADPYIIYQMGGRIYQCRVDTDNSIVDLSAAFGLTNPATTDKAFYAQGESFLVIQAGDYGQVPVPTLPLFWDGTKLRRSVGLTGSPTAELPAATCMVYYGDRLWYAQARVYTAGDIVFGPSGTAPYNKTDSILKVTENPLAVGGDGFSVPTSSGNIRALSYTANLDTSLGQGPLYVFTRGQIYQLIVPVTRADWIAANTNNMPQQTVSQIANGTASDTCVVPVNGDLFYQSLDPAIRSLISAIKYYGQWGNVPISNNEIRVIGENDRSLLHFASGIEFDNRLIQTALPTQTPSGVVHKALVPLDFDIISTLEERLPPAWEGVYETLPTYQLLAGNFGGRPRAFAVVQSSTGAVQLWEMTDFAQNDTNTAGESRITWLVETPAYTFGDEDQFKELDNAEFWFDNISGTCLFKLQYRQDGSLCWIDWHQWIICTARNSVEAGLQKYPIIEYCESDQRPVVMPKAPGFGCSPTNQRPTNFGYQFQLRLQVKGFCRLRSIRIFAFPRERQHYKDMVCLPYSRTAAPPAPTGDELGNRNTGDVFGNPSTGDIFGIPL